MGINFNTSKSAIGAASARLDASANNLANTSTPGHKSQKAEDVQLLGTGEGGNRDIFNISERGPLNVTGRPLDLTIDGEGAMPLKTPSGKVTFTRSASFHQDSQGRLVDNHGNQLIIDKYAERSEVGNGVSDLSVAKNGQITGLNNRKNNVTLGVLQAAIPANGGGIRYGMPGTNGIGEIRSGTLEGSNTDIASEMVDQIDISADIKANANVIRTQDEMVGTTLDIVG